MTVLVKLLDAWRVRAAELEPYNPGAAVAWREAAAELESGLREKRAEVLTLSEAAAESGYSKRRLRELLADGTIPQAGRKHAPRIRRADLPRKPDAGPTTPSAYDVDDDAAELAGRLK